RARGGAGPAWSRAGERLWPARGLRGLRAAFGFVEVVSHDPDDDPTAPPGEPTEGPRMADPRRMTAEEREQAPALLIRSLSDPDRETASRALDDLMRKLLVAHRLLEAE